MFKCLWSIWASDVGGQTCGGKVLLTARLISGGNNHFNMLKKSQPAADCPPLPCLGPHLGIASAATKTSYRSDHRDAITTNWVFSLLDSDPSIVPHLILSSNLPTSTANKRWLERSFESPFNSSSRAQCAPYPSLSRLTINRPPHQLP